jgi:hypothetical protein
MAKAPPIDDKHGFTRAACEACKNPDVWLTCNTCKKSDRFVAEEAHVRCHCGTTYAFATCTCGQKVPRDKLLWVAFDKGPIALADWEVDWGQVAVIGFIVAMLGVLGVAIAFATQL